MSVYQTSMTIITIDPDEIALKYPTIIDYYVKITDDPKQYRGPPVQRHDLYIVYTLDTTIMIDSYYRPRGYGDNYQPNGTKTLMETVMGLSRYDSIYIFLKNMKRKKKYHLIYRTKLKKWLGKARDNIMKRETDPTRCQELLNMGLSPEDVKTILVARIAAKLSIATKFAAK